MENSISICSCCGSEINTLSGNFCKVCGISNVTYPNVKEAAERESERVENFKRKYFNGDIQLKCFTYTPENGKYKLSSSKYVKLCDRTSYKPGEKIDLGMKFSELPSDRKITLNVRISKDNDTFDKMVDLVPEKTIGHSNLSLEFTTGLKARFMIINNNDTVYSDEFEM